MKSRLFIRIGAILMLLHVVGHSMGVFGKLDPVTAPVLHLMQSVSFPFMGRSCTLALFFTGYGLIMLLTLLLISILLWLLGGENSRLSSRLLGLLTGFLVIMAVLEYIYFFLLPAILSFLAAVLTGIGLYLRPPIPTSGSARG